MMSETKQIAMRVSIVSIILNAVLSVFKLLAGILANSGAMISDAVHSSSDVLSTFVVIAGVNISARKEDSSHPYGHERMESIAAFVWPPS
jgi:cation diffusion facilitator family transporter